MFIFDVESSRRGNNGLFNFGMMLELFLILPFIIVAAFVYVFLQYQTINWIFYWKEPNLYSFGHF